MTADDMLATTRCVICQALPYLDETKMGRLVRWQAAQLDRYASLACDLEVQLVELRARVELVTEERDTARAVAEQMNRRWASHQCTKGTR